MHRFCVGSVLPLLREHGNLPRLAEQRQGLSSHGELGKRFFLHIVESFMFSLYQQFEFQYPNGYLFYDRSGALSLKLRELFPGMVPKETDLNQREFSVAAQDVNLLFGIAVSQIHTVAFESKEFLRRRHLF